MHLTHEGYTMTTAAYNAIASSLSLLDSTELIQINRLLINRLKYIQRETARSWNVGERVTFTAHGRVHNATIIKVNLKNVKVLTDTGIRYNVSATFLKPGPPKAPPAPPKVDMDMQLYGLVDLPTTRAELRSIYNRKIMGGIHPDHGGTDSLFIQYSSAYERLKGRIAA